MSRPIAAHEVGEYAYCSRAWWLVHVRGAPALGGEVERREGLRRHVRHALGLAASRLAWRTGLVAAVLAAAVGATAWVSR